MKVRIKFGIKSAPKNIYLTCLQVIQFFSFKLHCFIKFLFILQELFYCLTMEVPATVLEILKCSSCENYLSRGPVYLQHDGAAICGRCYTPEHSATRDKYYEATAKFLRFPCKYRELGCHETVPFTDEEEVIPHEEVCEHRQYVCPVLGSASCAWLGTRAAMLAHCRDEHQDNVLESPCTLTHDISKSNINIYLIRAFQLLFLLHTKVCVATGKIFHSIQLLGESEEATNFLFSLDIQRNNKLISQEGQVDISNLLEVLGGFDGTTFTVTVKRKVDKLELSTRNIVTCAKCTLNVTVLRYRAADGWQCERCAPDRQYCRNQNCIHIDIDRKCEKHLMFFCQQRTKCYICDETVSPGALSAHYGAVHQDITCRAGSTWRATSIWGGYQLVTSAAGTAVCQYILDDVHLKLHISIPIANERLKEFRCEVQVINPTTRHTWSCTPGAEYDKDYDWRVQVMKEEFPAWCDQFDVIVQIKQME